MQVPPTPNHTKPLALSLRLATSLTSVALFAASIFCLTIPALGQSPPIEVRFGSLYGGLGGFNQSTTDPQQERWVMQTNSVRYINDDPDGGPDIGREGAIKNASLLRRFVLDRSPGQSYRVEGTVRLVDGYADDNNRVGLSLFSAVNDFGHEIGFTDQRQPNTLSLLYNTDDGAAKIRQGINSSELAVQKKQGGYLARDDTVFADTRVRLAADLLFKDDQTIEVVFTLVDDKDDTTTVSTVVQAADYTGDYFGFATRTRNRGVSSSNRNAPFTIDYENISVTKTDIPEPMSLALWGGALAGFLVVGRRRRTPT